MKASFEQHLISIETKGQDSIIGYPRKHMAMAGQKDDIAIIAAREDAQATEI